MLAKLIAFFAKLIATEKKCWAVWVIVDRAVLSVRSYLVARMIGAKGLRVHGGLRLRGSRFIAMGREVSLGRNCWIEAVCSYDKEEFYPRIVIGDGVSFSENVHISGINQIVVGKNVLMGSRIYVADHGHGLYKGRECSLPDSTPAGRRLGGGGRVLIEENVWIGDGVVIIGPVTIGSGSVIGANSVVCKDIPPNSIAVGSPARVIKVFDEVNRIWVSKQ